MRDAGLHNVVSLRTGDSNPYAYGEWLGAPGKPTVFLYAHHDVQPVNYVQDWKSDPWTLTPRDGRLYGRGAADDKGAIAAQLGAIAAYLKTNGSLPVNVKMLVEGEEEVGSSNLQGFFVENKDRLMSDVIVVCDTGNIETGLPCITYSLRGIVGPACRGAERDQAGPQRHGRRHARRRGHRPQRDPGAALLEERQDPRAGVLRQGPQADRQGKTALSEAARRRGEMAQRQRRPRRRRASPR